MIEIRDKPNYDTFLYDWDGCLANTLEVWVGTHKKVFAKYGIYPSTREVVKHLGNWKIPQIFGVTGKDVQACVEEIKETAHKELAEIQLYDGATKILKRSKSIGKVALLSSSTRQALSQGVISNGIEDIFDLIVTTEDVMDNKPNPEIINTAIELLGSIAIRAIMIGDSHQDLEAANDAGVDSALVFPEHHSQFYDIEQLLSLSPLYVSSSLGELESQLFDSRGLE